MHPAALLSLEKIYFRGGSSFPVFRVGEWTIGFSICYDNLFPESCRCLALRGAPFRHHVLAMRIGEFVSKGIDRGDFHGRFRRRLRPG